MQRNKVKRLLREAFAQAEPGLKPDQDVVVVARPPAGELAEREGLAGVDAALHGSDRQGGPAYGDGATDVGGRAGEDERVGLSQRSGAVMRRGASRADRADRRRGPDRRLPACDLAGDPQRCKYEPTCSRYAVEAIREYGILRGLVLAGWRLLRCNPWSHGGYDPVEAQRVFRIGDPRRGPRSWRLSGRRSVRP